VKAKRIVTESDAALEISSPAASELITLESEALRIKIWPRMGGKMISIVVRGHGSLADHPDRELLHPPIHLYNNATETSGFELSDGGGWDECFPSVAACSLQGRHIPDHGEIWRKPWEAVVKNEAVLAHVTASTAPLRFSRRISLDGPTMHLRYSVANTGSQGSDFLWSAHPLLRVEEGDRIVLPPSVDKVFVESSTVSSLVKSHGTCAWPIAELANCGHRDLSTVGPEDGATSYKLFAGPLDVGWCGIYRTRLQLGIVMGFNPTQTPFAGLWISQGAWPAGSSAPSQYTVALEPTTAPCDALDRAMKLGHSHHLLPQGEFSWPMQFEVFGSHTPIRYEEFLHLATTTPRH
jgi:hypothetical protein